MNHRFRELLKAKADDKSVLAFWGNDHPKCPHCGEVCDVNENEWYRLYEEGEHEVSCPHCDEDFSVSTTVRYKFSTDKQDVKGAKP